MKTPKIYVGEANNIDINNSDCDIFLFVDDKNVKVDDRIIDQAKLKFIELSERSKPLTPIPESTIKISIGVKPVLDRPKRRRIGQ